MDIQLQKSALIKQIELINDSDLLKSVKSLVEFGLKNQPNYDFELSDSTKKLLDERLNDYYKNPNDVMDFDTMLNEAESSL